MDTETLTQLEQITDTVTVPYEENDDPLHRTHIVNPPDNRDLWKHFNMTAQDIVNLARELGKEVVALCGYRFVPKHNPDKYDACEACMNVAGIYMRGKGE